MSKEINLEGISLEVLEAALKIIQTKEGRIEHLGEARVHAKYVCLLCGAEEEKEFYAKEVLCINLAGDVKWVTLIDENEEPVYSGTYHYTTHRTHCPRCLPRLCRLSKSELAELAITLSRASLWAARRAGKAFLDNGEEMIHEA